MTGKYCDVIKKTSYTFRLFEYSDTGSWYKKERGGIIAMEGSWEMCELVLNMQI